jgi:hypothetical protein
MMTSGRAHCCSDPAAQLATSADVISVGHWNEDRRWPGVALRGQRPAADAAGQVRRHGPEPRRRCARRSPPAGPVTWPLPEVEGAAPRFTRSQLCFVMSTPQPTLTPLYQSVWLTPWPTASSHVAHPSTTVINRSESMHQEAGTLDRYLASGR